MGISRVQHHFNQFKNILIAIPSIQKSGGATKSNPEIIKIARGIALFVLAILFAWISKNENERSTRNLVLTEEWPTQQIFLTLIKQMGWTEIQHADFSTLLKHHPDAFSEHSMIWESTDHCYLFLTHSPYDLNNETHIWACAQRTTPLSKIKWQRIGSGYGGVNQLSQISMPMTKKVRSYIDPKEIRY